MTGVTIHIARDADGFPRRVDPEDFPHLPVPAHTFDGKELFTASQMWGYILAERGSLRPAVDWAEKLGRFGRLHHRMGELWERHQGKGWPDAASDEFTDLRDQQVPALRAELERAIADGVLPSAGGRNA